MPLITLSCSLNIGAKILVCGDGIYMNASIRQALLNIQADPHNLSEVDVEVWFKNSRRTFL